MRVILFALVFINCVWAQQAHNMQLLSNYNNPNLPKVDGTDIWNDLTGWFNANNGNEFIIAGSTDSVYFFNISEPTNIKLVDVKPGKCNFARNRDFETYKNYVYCVADQASGIGALQIFDLQFLPDSAHKVYESNEFAVFTHTIHIDSTSKRLYMCGNSGSGAPQTLRILDLTNPEKPTLLANLAVPEIGGIPLFNYVHEMFARNDTVYLSCGHSGLFIFDLTDVNNQKLIGKITSYPDQGYNHSSWLNKSGKYLMFTDENMGLDVKVYDLSTFSDPKFVSMFNSSAMATPHNAYWYGDFAYVSSYHDGVQVWDLKNPAYPVKVAWYDTHLVEPEQYGGYKGCWGVYPYLPSKHIIASDLTGGIFVFKIDSNLVGNKQLMVNDNHISIYPNPVRYQFSVNFGSNQTQTANITLYNQLGVSILEKEIVINQLIDISSLTEGVYYLQIAINGNTITKKLIKNY